MFSTFETKAENDEKNPEANGATLQLILKLIHGRMMGEDTQLSHKVRKLKFHLIPVLDVSATAGFKFSRQIQLRSPTDTQRTLCNDSSCIQHIYNGLRFFIVGVQLTINRPRRH